MKTAAIIALAGMAAIASAQSAHVMLTHDDVDGVINVSESVTWSLDVAFTGGDAASGGNMSIVANASLGTSSDMTYGMVNGGNNGGLTDANGGIGFVSWTNSLFIEAFSGIPADHSNPYHVGSFTFTGTALGTLNYALNVGQALSAFVSIAPNAFGDTLYNPGDAGLTISIDSLEIIPTPASAALLGLGGLVAIRRRR